MPTPAPTERKEPKICEKAHQLAENLKSNDKWRRRIGELLPSGSISVEVFISCAIDALLNPASQEMFARSVPDSMEDSVKTAARLGVTLSGPFNQADLIAYNTEKNTGLKKIQCELNRNGLRDLAFRTGYVSRIIAHCVYENDLFECDLGDIKPITHKIDVKKDRGSLVAIYALMGLSNGENMVEIANISDINKLVNKHSSPPWKDYRNEMVIKTLIKKLCRMIPNKTGALAEMLQQEEAVYETPQIVVTGATDALSYLRDMAASEKDTPYLPVMPTLPPSEDHPIIEDTLG